MERSSGLPSGATELSHCTLAAPNNGPAMENARFWYLWPRYLATQLVISQCASEGDFKDQVDFALGHLNQIFSIWNLRINANYIARFDNCGQ
jgi:hypothetical protein